MSEYNSVVNDNKTQIRDLIAQKQEIKIEIAETRVETNDTNTDIQKIQKANKKLISQIESEIDQGNKIMDEVDHYHQLIKMVQERTQKKNETYKQTKSNLKYRHKDLKDEILGLQTDIGDLSQEINDTKDLVRIRQTDLEK